MSKSAYPGLVEEVKGLMEGGDDIDLALHKAADARKAPVAAIRMSYLRQSGTLLAKGQRGSDRYGRLLEDIERYEAMGFQRPQVMAQLMKQYGVTSTAINSAYYRSCKGATYWRGLVPPACELPAQPAAVIVARRMDEAKPESVDVIYRRFEMQKERSWPQDFRALLLTSESILDELIATQESNKADKEEIARLRAELAEKKEEPDAEELRRRFCSFEERARAHLPKLAQTGGNGHGC